MSSNHITLEEINRLNQKEFVDKLFGIYEHSPWIPERAYSKAPFGDGEDLAKEMRLVVAAASHQEQLGLIAAHPELAGKASVRKELTAESNQEQSGAGLDQCTPEEFGLLNEMNQAYNQKFGFPFILAVKGHNRHSIIQEFSKRLNNSLEDEFKACLEQIDKIATFRLNDLIGKLT
ncbi:MAG: 2-oxo-4-hydroxy-4-carboxy-5-ureidoimidazoline decarboxylase [Betaproteobacteria bacterium]|jgi:2-oxo-4-hydroxy-4-carboxy-5-ureidoimidazoline decarboxylase